MGLTRFNRTADEVQNGQNIKEIFGKYFILVVQGDAVVCLETVDPPTQKPDGGFEISSQAKRVPVYKDEGIYWINHQEDTRPSAPTSSGFGLGHHAMDSAAPAAINIAPPPPPLAPWAGRDMKPMPPSPLLSHKQTKHIDVDVGKGASRKMSFGNPDVGQKQISDFFNISANNTIAPMDF